MYTIGELSADFVPEINQFFFRSKSDLKHRSVTQSAFEQRLYELRREIQGIYIYIILYNYILYFIIRCILYMCMYFICIYKVHILRDIMLIHIHNTYTYIIQIYT